MAVAPTKKQVWLLAGAQHLYGAQLIQQVQQHTELIANELNTLNRFPVDVVAKGVSSSSGDILSLIQQANSDSNCVAVVFWMHTFSPAKNWIKALQQLVKPAMHWHTQFNRELPFQSIDMDYMNLHQSAHGDREFGFLSARMRKQHKIIVGHWQDVQTQLELQTWFLATLAWNDWHTAVFVRFGDNMRGVAVTEGDKLQAQLDLGFEVVGHSLEELNEFIQAVPKSTFECEIQNIKQSYDTTQLGHDAKKWHSLTASLQIELGLESFLIHHDYRGFTDCFENLGALSQLPGLAVQRLMQKGYGFGAEGDWKSCALLRAVKVMSKGNERGSSFMEDYTYHLKAGQELVLGAHMLEVCPSIKSHNTKERVEVHSLALGGKSDPARLVFEGAAGPALNIALIDMGSRFRLIAAELDAVASPETMPKLPTARALWKPRPDFKTAVQAWVLAGGGHHTVYTQAVGLSQIQDFSELAGIELVRIDKNTELNSFMRELKWNDLYYHMSKGLR